ncbi:MAG: LVIVD repeat-containing protein [Ginsengibacter sp.]
MKTKLIYLLLLPLFLCQCEKDSSSFNKSTGTMGQGGSMAKFAIAGNYLYSVDDKQLKSFDISNALKPVLQNTQNVGFEIETIFPFQDKLFIGSATQVYIYSIEDPAKPKLLSSAISPQVMRRCDPVVAKDSVAFATLRTNGPCGGSQSVLAVYNIKDITNPVQVTTYPVGEPYGLGYSGDILYVCDKQRGLILFDISLPYQPHPINININDGSYVDVIPYQTTLICRTTTGIILYDITDNRKPVLIKTIN